MEKYKQRATVSFVSHEIRNQILQFKTLETLIFLELY